MALAETIDKQLYSELADLGQHPPGEDPSLGAFYQAVVGMVDDGHPIVGIINKASLQRPLTAKHVANLLFRGVQ